MKPYIFSGLSRNRTMNFIRRAVPLMLILPVFSSCIKEEFNADRVNPSLQIHPGVAAPIGWAKYRLDEILLDSLNPDEMIIGNDGFISMIYNQEIFSSRASEIISIPDASMDQDLVILDEGTWDLNTLPDSGHIVIFQIPVPLDFNGTNGASVDSIRMRAGYVKLSASVVPDYPDLNWRIDFKIKGIPGWQDSLDKGILSLRDSLDGLVLPLDSANNAIQMMAFLTLFSCNVILEPGPVLTISVDISGLEYEAIYGYLGQFPVNAGPEYLSVDFFNRTVGGTFYFRDPTLTIRFQNSFGLPIQLDSLNLTAMGRDGQVTRITGDSIPDPSHPRRIAYPQLEQEGQTVRDSIVLDRDNTTLFDVLETSPRQILVREAGATNPAGERHDNFILDTSRLSVSTRLVLPLDGYADLLLIADTLDFIFADFYNNPPEEIKRLVFRLDYISQFPVDVSTQLVFLAQDKHTELDSLFHDTEDPRMIVKGAPIGADGIAIPYRPEPPVEIELTREQIDHISSCYYILAKGRVTTTEYESPDGPTDVRFYSYYYIHAYIGAIAELEVNSDDY